MRQSPFHESGTRLERSKNPIKRTQNPGAPGLGRLTAPEHTRLSSASMRVRNQHPYGRANRAPPAPAYPTTGSRTAYGGRTTRSPLNSFTTYAIAVVWVVVSVSAGLYLGMPYLKLAKETRQEEEIVRQALLADARVGAQRPSGERLARQSPAPLWDGSEAAAMGPRRVQMRERAAEAPVSSIDRVDVSEQIRVNLDSLRDELVSANRWTRLSIGFLVVASTLLSLLNLRNHRRASRQIARLHEALQEQRGDSSLGVSPSCASRPQTAPCATDPAPENDRRAHLEVRAEAKEEGVPQSEPPASVATKADAQGVGTRISLENRSSVIFALGYRGDGAA